MDVNRLRNQLLREMEIFYTPSNFAQIHNILIGEDVLSMSIINYVVTNYSKELSSYITIDDRIIYISRSYKQQLDEYTKKCYDPFCREPKIHFMYDKKNQKTILTSVAQLNFYRWAIEINLLSFIRDNYEQILAHMKIKSLSKHSSSKSATMSASTASERMRNKVIIVKQIKTDFMNDDV